MRGVIIGGGIIKDYDYIKSFINEGDYLICADGGYDHAIRMGLKPYIVIGDMDSAKATPADVDVIKYPCDKDYTDGELCVRYAREHGMDSLLLVGMTSDRLDHTINNVLMLKDFQDAEIIDESNHIYVLDKKLRISEKKGATLSIIPLGGNLEGVSTKNLLYSLDNENLYFGESRGNSNIMTDDECEINVKKGWGIVIIPR